MELKNAAKEDCVVKEVREGLSYKSGIEMTSYANADLQQIPEPMAEPVLEHVPEGIYEEVVFDLETTDLGGYNIV